MVIRFKEGIKTLSGDHVTPNIIRLGRSDAINAAVRDVTIEELVDGRLAVHDASKTSASDNSADPVEMREEMNKLLAERAAIRLAKETARGNGESEKASELVTQERQLSDKIRIVGRRIDAQQDAQNTERRNHDIMRRKIQQEIMDESHIICATLSGAGHEMLKGVNVEFETVVIDEAAQSIELSALIPLKYGSAKCILVGDPKQLVSIILSSVSRNNANI